jgi:hypothetical protein
LFLKYKDVNEFDGKEVIAMAKDAESGLWVRRFTGSWEVLKSNPKLADEIESWSGNAAPKAFSDPPAKSPFSPAVERPMSKVD